MRVAELDVHHGPQGLKPQDINGTRTCVVDKEEGGCTLILFHSITIPYIEVCGQARGYRVGTVNGFYRNRMVHGFSISDNYLDGMSLAINGTHFWSSFFAGNCDCMSDAPSFVNTDWTCEGLSAPWEKVVISVIFGIQLYVDGEPPF